MLTEYQSTCGLSVNPDVDGVLIMGINQHLTAVALSTYDPVSW